jgi:hypothetical protein
MKKPVLFGILFLMLVLGVIVYSSMTLAAHRVEVCIEFNGRTNCKIASGATLEFAEHTAVDNACGEIASGVTDSMNCTRSQPVKMTVLK